MIVTCSNTVYPCQSGLHVGTSNGVRHPGLLATSVLLYRIKCINHTHVLSLSNVKILSKLIESTAHKKCILKFAVMHQSQYKPMQRY
jgi:hypothetical protein